MPAARSPPDTHLLAGHQHHWGICRSGAPSSNLNDQLQQRAAHGGRTARDLCLHATVYRGMQELVCHLRSGAGGGALRKAGLPPRS